MPQRNIIGPIVDAGGAGLPVGELQVTPVLPAGEAADGFVAKMRKYPISNGQVTAPVIVPGSYKLDIVSESGERLRAFTADIPATSLVDITLKELWDSRSEVVDISPLTMHEGDNILRLAPGGGVAGQMLSQADGHLRWRNPPRDGDMISSQYDPLRRQVDVYDRANHVGTQPISSVSGLSAALGLVEYASICDQKPKGTGGGAFTSGSDQLRTLNTILFNNSGLADNVLLDTATSAMTLRAGRVYVGFAAAPAAAVGTHYLRIKSTDGSIDIAGPREIADSAGGTAVGQTYARIDFRIVVPAGVDKQIQIFHRGQSTQGIGFGYKSFILDDGLPEEYARITILSRPI